MSELSPSAALSLIKRLEQQLADAGLQVVVEHTEGTLVLNGIVDSEESRQAAADIASEAAPGMPIDNQLEVESEFPTDIDEFASGDASAELSESVVEIRAEAGRSSRTSRTGQGSPILSRPQDPMARQPRTPRSQAMSTPHPSIRSSRPMPTGQPTS